ncbi:MAG: GGDEF domain-containing protein [Actinomycetes bacterium]
MGEWSDPLTGLDSAPYFREHVQDLLARRPETFQPFLYGVSRINKFEEIVEGSSSSFGDALLVSAAHAAQLIVRGGDRVGRLGRDHFGFALLAAHPSEASACEARLRTALTYHDFASQKFELHFAFIWIGDSRSTLAEIEYDIDLALALHDPKKE